MTAMQIAVPVYLIFLAAAIVGGVYMFMYRRKINKALQENNGRHVNMPDGRSVLVVILVCVLFFGVFHTKALVEQLQNNMDVMYMNLSNDIDDLQNDIDDLQDTIVALKQASELIESVNYTVESFDVDAKTVRYEFELVLKTYSDSTKVSMNIGEYAFDLELEAGGKFYGILEMNMFENLSGETYVMVEEGGVTTTEKMDYFSIDASWKEFIPHIFTKAASLIEYENNTLKITPDLMIFFENTENGTFKDAHIEIDLRGDEITTVDIGFVEGKNEYSVDLDKHLPKIYPADQMYVFVVATDSLGFTHKALVNAWYDGGLHMYEDYELLYDKDGNKLTEKVNGIDDWVDVK